ncbi:MAD2L1-binding protein [Myripristis murdjan]|uniref:MAD2L1 binding protein n=1 Tax=Myripristis murdjan TaxID=586833 RepID=A0A667YHY4_9TELE|nr:MAD2L1-binding protein [Myripristis murdjan]
MQHESRFQFPMMQRERDPGTFKSMAEESHTKPAADSEVTEDISNIGDEDYGGERRPSFSPEEDLSVRNGHDVTCEVLTLDRTGFQGASQTCSHRAAAEVHGQLPSQVGKTETSCESKDVPSERRVKANKCDTSGVENKENTTTSSHACMQQEADTSRQRSLETPPLTTTEVDNTEDRDAEVVRRAQEEGRVDVVFPGSVTQDACCRFVTEILKCILYQRQQLPMTYDQLLYSQRKQQASVQNKEVVSWRPSADIDLRKCQRTLQELEEVLQQLEVLFSLSRVPRVLLLLGGSLILPKEMYEINMEALSLTAGDQSLRVSTCLRQLFRTLFVADLLSDARSVHLMATTVLVLAHRDCGVAWFRPKLNFKVPTRVQNQIIALSTDPGICVTPCAEESDWQDYVWFQAPMTIKGFSK